MRGLHGPVGIKEKVEQVRGGTDARYLQLRLKDKQRFLLFAAKCTILL